MLARTKPPYWVAAIVLLGLAVGGASTSAQEAISTPETTSTSENTISVETTSGEAEMALAQHLQKINAKVYIAYWCPHCHRQMDLFGKEASNLINRIECSPDGKNAQTEVCYKAGIKAFPSWEINGELTAGVKTLEELADLSGYQGSRGFKNIIP
ncbi:MAG TPA: hypothetical protein V6D14_20505 [Coleofasciculaceae cyanobacterium]|jgi:thiol-disulfide isomerase/thioredoxin